MGYNRISCDRRLIHFLFNIAASFRDMHKHILKIALPSIVSNIVVPLLGVVDLAIAGHLGAPAFIGAVSVGATMFNLIYWNFGFLRMGTSGMTAQAYGQGNGDEAVCTLRRAVALALALGIAIIALQYPLQWILLEIIAPDAGIAMLARDYFFICVWGAPALLATMSFTGWFIGMQNAAYPMAIAIAINIINIATSLICVFPLGLGFHGIAVGTLVAQWSGLLLSALQYMKTKRKERLPKNARGSLFAGMGRFFRINSDIFLRSLCLMAVTLFFTSAGARSGEITLAVNALLMQLYLFFSYFMDGFAFAGEALVGRFAGAKDEKNLRKCVNNLFIWGSAMAVVFSATYGAFGEEIISLLTDQPAVNAAAADYLLWAAIMPLAGMAAFVWDGIFVGLTATRQMLFSLAASTTAFFALYYIAPTQSNNMLWLSFAAFLIVRGMVLLAAYRRLYKF